MELLAQDTAKYITYAEVNDEPAFDWNVYVSENEHDKDKAAYKQAKRMAADWVTCACGNQCSLLPRSEGVGRPLDKILAELGLKFYHAIADDDMSKAREILGGIENRSAHLLTLPGYIDPANLLQELP